jgi:hypothetical protein
MPEQLSPLDIICKVLREYMDLPGRVVKYNQGYQPPKDANEYVVVSADPATVIGRKAEFNPDTNTETDSVSMIGRYNIDISSRNANALDRKEEVVMALESLFALREYEANNIRVWIAGNILDLSAIEGASVLARYRIPIAVSYAKEKTIPAEYFDKFRKTKILEEA